MIRSIGGPENLREHRKGPKWSYDDRILGEGEFVESVLKNVAIQNSYQDLSKEQKQELFQKLLESLCEQYKIKPAELVAGSKRRKVSEVRSLLSYGAHRELGLNAAEIGRVLNVSGQTVMKGASRAEETWESLDWIMEGIRV